MTLDPRLQPRWVIYSQLVSEHAKAPRFWNRKDQKWYRYSDATRYHKKPVELPGDGVLLMGEELHKLLMAWRKSNPTCALCGGTGWYNTEVRARYGDPPFRCDCMLGVSHG